MSDSIAVETLVCNALNTCTPRTHTALLMAAKISCGDRLWFKLLLRQGSPQHQTERLDLHILVLFIVELFVSIGTLEMNFLHKDPVVNINITTPPDYSSLIFLYCFECYIHHSLIVLYTMAKKINTIPVVLLLFIVHGSGQIRVPLNLNYGGEQECVCD